MSEDGQSPSTSDGWRTGSFRENLLGAVQRARSQEISTELIEDLRTALDMISQALPPPQPHPPNGPANDNANEDNGPDAVVVVLDEESSSIGSNASSSNWNARHRLTASGSTTSDTTQRPVATTSAMEGGESTAPEGANGSPTEGNNGNGNRGERSLLRELNRLRGLRDNREFQRLWDVILNVLPFVIFVFCKMLIDSFSSLFNLVVAFFCFHLANGGLLAALRGRKCLHLLESNAFAVLYFSLQYYFYGLDPILRPMYFMTVPTPTITFFSTLHVVLVTDLAVKNITVQLKGLVALIPSAILSNKRQRRIFQWIEYTSQMYRFCLPVPQWSRFLGHSEVPSAVIYYSDHFFAILYTFYKLCLIPIMGHKWVQSTRYMCRLSSIGVSPSRTEVEYAQQCTICCGDFECPVKLSCSHIFCEECIGTWLDKEYTCPMCRATVVKEDNTWKSGETSFAPQIC